MRIERRYTKEGQSPYADIKFRLTTSEIKNPDGSIVFKADNVEVPEFWSQVASDVLAQKYFRKAGVPSRLKKVEEETVPSFLWRSTRDDEALQKLPDEERSAGEQSSKQVFDRLAGTWTYWGWKGGYFNTEADAQAFFDELRFMLASQMCAPNSPQWFNTGLHWAYGIDGPSQGHHYVDFKTGKLTKSKSSYEHPQPHACFIQSIADDLVNEGGIMDLWVREARLFKYGSGTGTNFSSLRGEGERLGEREIDEAHLERPGVDEGQGEQRPQAAQEIEAGLERAVAMGKGDFRGRAALERQIRDDPLQPRILFAQRLHFLRFAHVHATVFLLPGVYGVLRHAHLAGDLFGLSPRLHLLHRANHLRFRVGTPAHPLSPYLRPIIGRLVCGFRGEGHANLGGTKVAPLRVTVTCRRVTHNLLSGPLCVRC